jgi:hypothetical protein
MLIVSVASSCQRLPNVQGLGAAELQGVWNQDSTPNADKLLNYTEHRFKFSCDSFYVDLTTHSKVNYYEDSCFNNGVWKEYAKGVYALRNDSLFLEGTYTKANYKQKVSGCYHTGRYIKSFLVKAASDSSITLLSLANQRTHTLILKGKMACIPKHL